MWEKQRTTFGRWLSGLVVLALLWVVGVASPTTQAASLVTYTSVSSGNWSDPAIWNLGTVPTSADMVVIANGTTVAVDGNHSVMSLSVQNGGRLNIPVGTGLTVAQFVSNIGRIAMTRSVDTGTVVFEIPSGTATPAYRMVDITPAGTALGNVTVIARGLMPGEYCANTDSSSPQYVRRCVEINVTTNAAAVVRLWFTNGERNGLATGVLTLYRSTGSLAWSQITTNASAGTADNNNYYYVEATTPGFSSFLSGGTTAPTAITLKSFTATSGQWDAWLWVAGLLLLVGVVGLGMKKVIG